MKNMIREKKIGALVLAAGKGTRMYMDFADWCVKNLDFIDASRISVDRKSVV